MSARGRGWAYGGALLGGAVSIAANVAHSYVPPEHAAASWSPHTGAVIGAVFWPAALFVAIEILARTGWPSGRRWVLLRFGGLVPVAVVAALVSYRHLSGLLAFYGEDAITATLGPLAVDGLMVMATGALIATAALRPVTPAEPVSEHIAEPVPAQVAEGGTPSGEHENAPAPVPAARRPAKRPAREDAELLPLLRPVHATEPLTRRKVQTLTDVSARQADRLVAALRAGDAEITHVNGRAPEVMSTSALAPAPQ